MGDALRKKMSAQTSLKAQVESAQIVEKVQDALKELFGDEARHVKVLFVKNKTLTITCHSSVIAQEIRLNQAKIIEKIRNLFPSHPIERIRYLS